MSDQSIRIPNATTTAALQEARAGEGVATYVSLDELQREFD